MPKRALERPAPGDAPVVGETRAARDFYAGQYAKVASETFDHVSMEVAEPDVAFAVGALTFLGRVDDARACFEAWKERPILHDVRTLAASRFFLGLAFARGGDYVRARQWLVERARERIDGADTWGASFVFQGLACYRYFTGRYRASARHALRALRAAHAARLAYAQMLSTDLRGHALVQLGQLHAGTALLDQARSLAERLGFGLNAHAIECSIAIYRAKLKLGSDALDGLQALLARTSHDSYSRRMLLTQSAVQYALRGRGSQARSALEEADRDALKLDVRRAKVTSLIARLHVTRFAAGAAACAELLDQAAALTAEGDVAFRAELSSFQLYVARALGDEARGARALEALRSLRRRSEHHVLTQALAAYEPDKAPVFAEDEVTPLLRAASERDERALGRMLGLGVLGPIPELLGLVPARRLILLAAENTILVEDRGDVVARSSPPRWLAPLVRILGTGSASKERIVAELWGLKRYSPERHDSLVRTTIHRLRAFLEPRGEWVTVTAEGYGLRAAVHVVGAPLATTAHEVVLPDDDAYDVLPPARKLPRAAPSVATEHAILEQLGRGALASVPEVAEAVGLSESTVLRALRRLVKGKRVKRTGAARATRYRLR